MNKTKYILTLILALGFTAAFGQFKFKKNKTVTIQSNIVCGMCIDNLNEMFQDYYAVKKVDYDLKKKTITVTYNRRKTNLEKIEKRISKVGYQANNVLPVQEARAKLAECCKGDVCEVQQKK